MTKITKTLAREWLTLIGGIVVGFLIVPTLLYILFSNLTDAPNPSLIKFYTELIEYVFLDKGRDIDVWSARAFVLGPYVLYQFSRSVMWAIRTMKEH